MNDFFGRRFRNGRRLALGTFAAALLVGGVAYATVPDSGGVIHGCYKQKGGSLRVIDTDAGEKCASSELEVNWNQTGPTGAQGAQGLRGVDGVDGADGSSCSVSRSGEIVTVACTDGTSESWSAPSPPDRFAGLIVAAWTETDGADGFGVEDVLIASLGDTNGNCVPDAGDTVIYGQYPLNFAGTEFGTFATQSGQIDSVDESSSDPFRVNLAFGGPGATMAWAASPGYDGWHELDGADNESAIIDFPGQDAIATDQRTPGQPDSFVWEQRSGGVDDNFIEVRFFNPCS